MGENYATLAAILRRRVRILYNRHELDEWLMERTFPLGVS
jgi:hypothetical protein